MREQNSILTNLAISVFYCKMKYFVVISHNGHRQRETCWHGLYKTKPFIAENKLNIDACFLLNLENDHPSCVSNRNPITEWCKSNYLKC